MMRRDVPAMILERAVKWMPAARREWAEAMMAELEHVEGRTERFRFALGCLWVALFPPGGPGRVLAMAHGPSGLFSKRPRMAAWTGLLFALPFWLLNLVVVKRLEPVFSWIRPGPHTSAQEYWALAVVLLLMPAGALIAMLPSLALESNRQRRFYAVNCTIAVLLFIIFGVIATALGSEIYYCEYLQVPNCD